MRNIITILIFATLISCKKDIEVSAPAFQGTPVIVTAALGNDPTKSHFDGSDFGDLYWDSGEKLNVYYYQSAQSKWAEYTLTEGADNRTGRFTGAHVWSEDETVASHDFVAVYPVNDYNQPDGAANPAGIFFSVTGNQTAKDYSKYHICAAVSSYEGGSLPASADFAFQPLLSYLKLNFRLDPEAVPEEGKHLYLPHMTVFTDETPIAGNFTLNLEAFRDGYDSSEWFSTKGDSRAIYISLIDEEHPNGPELTAAGDSEESGVSAYAVMLPADLTGKALRFYGVASVHDTEENKWISYPIVPLAKKGVNYQPGTGYTMSLKITPDTESPIPIDAGRLVRANGEWYDFDAVAEDPTLIRNSSSIIYFTQGFSSPKPYTKTDMENIVKITKYAYEKYNEGKAEADWNAITLSLIDANFEDEGGLENAGIFAGDYLGNVILPKGMTKINKGLFAGCTKLKTVTLPTDGQLTTIGDHAFYDCVELENIVIPNSVTSLSNGVFRNCRSLKSVKLPIHLTALPNNLFAGCESLESIDIPASVVGFGSCTFTGCSGLKTIRCHSQIDASSGPFKATRLGDKDYQINNIDTQTAYSQTGEETAEGERSVIVSEADRDYYEAFLTSDKTSGWPLLLGTKAAKPYALEIR